ncbi:LuxR C-terminal-related transcriptional regulator [Mycobacterium sp. NPDC003323]
MTASGTAEGLLHEARTALGQQNWRGVYEAYVRVDGVGPMPLSDLDSYAEAAWRLGHGREAVRLAERVYGQLVRSDPAAAAMKALELGLEWVTRGDLNIARGWMSRARRLIADPAPGPAMGYLVYLEALVAWAGRDIDELQVHADRLREISAPLGDPSLDALTSVAAAMAAFGNNRPTDGCGHIDEAMLPVLAGEVTVDWAGDIYCVVLNLCHQLADQPRMRAWTDAMQRWCDVHQTATYYRVCDVHRLQLAAADQDYRHLEEQLFTASCALEGVNDWVSGEGFYQLGEVRRLRGDTDGALAAFAKARSLGVDPQPGLALLRCRMGDSQSAWTELRVALAGVSPLSRMRMLRAAVDIALARDDLDEAQRHCAELQEGARSFGTPGYRAWAAHARGAVLTRLGEHGAALESLNDALRFYREQRARYESAEVYEWMALAHRGIGDESATAADIATAEAIYEQLAVQPSAACGRPVPGGLTRREIEVLRALAGGATNRQVAQAIFISEKTVGRHLANIYAKLGVSSRTAALTWAYQHKIVNTEG